MGTGIVFVYLIIVALAAPIVWLLWWAVDSFGGPRLRPAAVAAAGTRTRALVPYPRAVDFDLPSRVDSVTIFSLRGRQLDTCQGPNSEGLCPRPDADGVVPCSGCVLALPRPLRGSFEWQIPAQYHACLLGSYAAFRHTP